MADRTAPEDNAAPDATSRTATRTSVTRRRSVGERIAFDINLCHGGTVAGADEAGRGSLAGPLVAAAVCFDYGQLPRAVLVSLDAIDDSKRLSSARRAQLCITVLRHARQVAVVCCSPRTIDRDGLHRTNLWALAAVLEAISPRADVALVDGFALPAFAPPHQAVVGGDGRSAAIAAASIVAKVTRDRLMVQLHELHPAYGFDKHVGYATAAHHAAIRAVGTCELHRLSFASVAWPQLQLSLGDDGQPL